MMYSSVLAFYYMNFTRWFEAQCPFFEPFQQAYICKASAYEVCHSNS